MEDDNQASTGGRTGLYPFSGDEPRFGQPTNGRLVQRLNNTGPKRFQLTGDFRTQRAKEQGINEPTSVRVVATKGILPFDARCSRHRTGCSTVVTILRSSATRLVEWHRQQGLGQPFLAAEVVIERGLGDTSRVDDFAD